MSEAVAQPIVPNYGSGCVTNLVPTLLGPSGLDALPEWFPTELAGARQVVLLVLDGLGWNHLQREREHAPTLSTMTGGPITTVAPSTTATALTSIATGLTPGEHGIVGYRMMVRGEVLNVLRWSTPTGDARKRIGARECQPVPAFLGTSVPMITKAEFATSGFSAAHLSGGRHVGYRAASTLVVEVGRLLAAGERFVYAYYDGIDKVAHEYGFGPYLDAELAATDALVAAIIARLPSDAVLLVTADHGQVQVGAAVRSLPPALLAMVAAQSGEGRFRWLHARPGAAGDVLAAASAAHRDEAWVCPVAQVVDEGWLGARVSDAARARLGDVALVPFAPVSFHDPADSGPFELVCRHGSLTADEMLVPLLARRA